MPYLTSGFFRPNGTGATWTWGYTTPSAKPWENVSGESYIPNQPEVTSYFGTGFKAGYLNPGTTGILTFTGNSDIVPYFDSITFYAYINNSGAVTPWQNFYHIYFQLNLSGSQLLSRKDSVGSTGYWWSGTWSSFSYPGSFLNNMKLYIMPPYYALASGGHWVYNVYAQVNYSGGVVGERINASYISGAIAKLNQEDLERTGSLSDVSEITQGDPITPTSLWPNVINLATGINQIHCYCQADGTMETHQGGTWLDLKSPDNTQTGQGVRVRDIEFIRIEKDASDLSGQCACDSHECTCETRQVFTCTCNTDCSCHSDCGCASNISIK